jgi:hypothetical protein
MKGDYHPCPDRVVMPRFDPDLIQAACTDGDARAIEEFSTTLSGNLVQRETRTRQGETQLVVRGEALPDSLIGNYAYRMLRACARNHVPPPQRARRSHATASEAIRALIDEVRLIPDKGELRIGLYGELGALIGLANKHPRSRETGAQVTLVAGAQTLLFRTQVSAFLTLPL